MFRVGSTCSYGPIVDPTKPLLTKLVFYFVQRSHRAHLPASRITAMSKYIYEENVLIFGLVCSHKFSTSVRYLWLSVIHSVITYCNENVLRLIIKIQLLFTSPVSFCLPSHTPLPILFFSRLFLLFRVYSFQQLRAHLVSIPMTMSSSFVKITVTLGVVFTKPFPRQSVLSSLFLTYVSALSSRQVYRPLIPAEAIFKSRAWRLSLRSPWQ